MTNMTMRMAMLSCAAAIGMMQAQELTGEAPIKFQVGFEGVRRGEDHGGE